MENATASTSTLPTSTSPNYPPPSIESKVEKIPITIPVLSGPTIIPTLIDEEGKRIVPTEFECCELEDLIILISSMLDRLIIHNDRIPLTPTSLTRFHSRAPPTISVTSYLTRISRYTNVEPCVLLSLLPYVDKICSRLNSFTISSLTVHRFIIAGVSVGSKALSDAFCTNGRYARVGGVGLSEMGALEREFCESVDWRLTTTGAVLKHYYTSLVRSHPSYILSTTNPTPPPTAIPILLPSVKPPPLIPTHSSNSSSTFFRREISDGLASTVNSPVRRNERLAPENRASRSLSRSREDLKLQDGIDIKGGTNLENELGVKSPTSRSASATNGTFAGILESPISSNTCRNSEMEVDESIEEMEEPEQVEEGGMEMEMEGVTEQNLIIKNGIIYTTNSSGGGLKPD